MRLDAIGRAPSGPHVQDRGGSGVATFEQVSPGFPDGHAGACVKRTSWRDPGRAVRRGATRGTPSTIERADAGHRPGVMAPVRDRRTRVMRSWVDASDARPARDVRRPGCRPGGRGFGRPETVAATLTGHTGVVPAVLAPRRRAAEAAPGSAGRRRRGTPEARCQAPGHLRDAARRRRGTLRSVPDRSASPEEPQVLALEPHRRGRGRHARHRGWHGEHHHRVRDDPRPPGRSGRRRPRHMGDR